MSWILIRDAVTGLHFEHSPNLSLGQSGPIRTETSTADPAFKPRPVGFTANLHTEVEPLVWEGDNA